MITLIAKGNTFLCKDCIGCRKIKLCPIKHIQITIYAHRKQKQKKMAYAGTIGSDVAARLLKAAHDNFDDLNFDITPAKQAMAKYIAEHCQTQRTSNPPATANSYALQTAGSEGLKMTMKTNSKTCYLFNIENGDVIVAEFDAENHTMIMRGAPFDFVVMAMTNGAHSVRPRLLKPPEGADHEEPAAITPRAQFCGRCMKVVQPFSTR